MVRFTKKDEVDPILGVHTATGCIAHRCDAHADLPPVNQWGPNESECGGCVGQAFAEALEKAFEEQVYWPMVQKARDRLNLLSAGAGTQFEDEARALLVASKES